MANNAKIELNGNLGNDAKLIEKDGKTFVSLSVATRNSYPVEKNGETVWEDNKNTVWHDVVIFSESVVTIAQELKKGDRVEVVGTLSYRPFKDENGYSKNQASIVAHFIRKIEFNKTDETEVK